MVRDSAAYLGARAVNGALSLVTLAVLTRLLEPAQYGKYALGMAAIATIAFVAYQWINASIARFYLPRLGAEDGFLAEAFRVFKFVSPIIAAAAVLWWCVEPAAEPPPAMALVVGLSAIALGLHDVCLQIANTSGQPLRYGAISATRAALFLLFAVTLIALGLGATGVLAAFGAACLVAAAFLGRPWSQQLLQRTKRPRSEFLAYGFPVALASLMTMLLAVSDRFLIGWWHGVAGVAGYAAAHDFTQQVVGVALNIFLMASYPRITAAWELGGAPVAREQMLPLARAYLLTVPLVAGVFIGMASEIARVMLGDSLAGDAARVMPWIAVAISIGCFKSYFLDIALHLSKSTALIFRITAVMALLSVSLNFFLIPRLGGLGAAVSLTAAHGVGAALSWWFGRAVGVYPRWGYEPIKAVLSLVMLVAVLALMSTIFVEGGVLPQPVAVGLQFVTGLIVFGLVSALTDLGHVRSTLVALLRKSQVRSRH